MHDYYHVLGIGRSASAQIARLAFDGKMKALADPAYAASAEEKRAEERLLREAFVTLSVPAKRGPYDAKLAAFEDQGGAGTGSRPAWFAPAIGLGILVVAASGIWMNHSNDKERLRMEEERLAMEKENTRRKADLDAERIRDYKARQDEASETARSRNEQQRVARERVDYDRWRRTEELRAVQSEAARASLESRAKNEKLREEAQVQRTEQERVRAAQREVDRQKEYLRRQEIEEERARAARHAQAEREAREREYRQYLEEQKRRLQQR
ncbi:MAG: hypothetical protein IPP91_03815 [Betaproteobacteria bacterium]|nr:hypothetical protein [Betaproteobacteria bacterium]